MKTARMYWAALREPGMEYLRLEEEEHSVTVHGTVLGVVEAAPFYLTYELRADTSWRVRECLLVAEAAHDATLRLAADGLGHWTNADGSANAALEGCLDIDISVTPFTNTLPIRRLALAPGASVEISVAYISLPELSVRPARQRYTCLTRGATEAVYRYEGLESGFRADVLVDGDSLVVEYPGIWKRIEAPTSGPR